VVEHLSCKHEALNSNPSYCKQNKTKTQEKKKKRKYDRLVLFVNANTKLLSKITRKLKSSKYIKRLSREQKAGAVSKSQ
jgi:hypothetical protein